MTSIKAEIQTLPTDLPAVNVDVLRTWLDYTAAQVEKADGLDAAEVELRRLADGQNMFVYRGGNHLALHILSGHSARMLFVTEAR